MGRLALAAARAGAAAILRVSRTGPMSVRTKSGPADLVTTADLAAESAILQVIRTARPDDAVLTEESGEHAGRTDVRWLVDPLDGTTNFVHGRPDYAVSVAAERHGTPAAGAVVRPSEGDWVAAWDGEIVADTGTSVGVSPRRDLGEALVGFDLPAPPGDRDRIHAFLSDLVRETRDYRRSGSSACELLAVACGRQEAYLGFGDQ